MTLITGVIKAIDTPQDASLTTVQALIKDMEKYLAVEFDVEKITNVFVSSVQPDNTERDVIWFRINNAGNFIGIFVYIQSQWLQMFPPPNAITRVYGDSRDIAPGFVLVSTDLSGFNSAMVAKLQESWITEGDHKILFDVVYVGL